MRLIFSTDLTETLVMQFNCSLVEAIRKVKKMFLSARNFR
jgi:hypothetical protein